MDNARTKLNRIVQRIRTLADMSVPFENIISVTERGLECGEDLMVHSRLAINIEKFSEVLRELVKKIQLKTLKLRF